MIHARGLTKTFSSRKGKQRVEVLAVAGVDIDVSEGEIVGFLGPNGAGKTTTLRMLNTLLKPTAGEATVAGANLLTNPLDVRRRIGYVAQSGSASREAISGEEVVDHAMLYRLTKATATERGRKLFEQLDLQGLWTRKAGTLSGGQRRRLDIVMGLVHEPKLVFLDEPTTGLDPQARANLWKHIGALRSERGSTVFLTTHYMDEADALCDRLLVIDNGSIVASDTPDALKRRVSGERIEIVTADPRQTPAVVARLEAVPGVSESFSDGNTVSARVPRAASELPGLLRAIDSDGIALQTIDVRRPTLDDVFLTLTGRSLRENA